MKELHEGCRPSEHTVGGCLPSRRPRGLPAVGRRCSAGGVLRERPLTKRLAA